MGVYIFFSPQNRGGGSFMPFLHIAKGLPSCLPSSSPVVNFQPIGANFRQKGSKVNIYLLDFVSPRENRRQQTAKFKIYLSFEGAGASVVALSLGRWWCPLGAGGAGCRASGVLRCVFRPFLPAFALFPAFLSYFAFQICPISRFKGVFRGFYGADVYLYGLRSLR